MEDSPSQNREAPTDDEVIDRLESVSHGAVVATGSLSAQKTLLFLTNFALTQGLTATLYGVYAFGRRISGILLLFGPLGGPAALVRYLPAADTEARQRRVFGLACGTALVASLTFGAVVFLLADAINAATLDHPTLPIVLRLFAVLVLFDVAIRLSSTVFRALGMIEYHLAVTLILRPATRLVGIVAALAVGSGVIGVVAAFVAMTAIVAVLTAWLLTSRTPIRPAGGASRAEAREFINYAGPNALSKVGSLFQNRIDVLLVGFLLTAQAAGVYNLALFLMSLLAVPLFAFNQLLPPIVSELYAEGEVEMVNEVYGAVTRLIVTLTAPIAVVTFVYRVELLAVFGEVYTAGSLVLGVFVIGRVIGNGAGATGWLLLMTDHQYLHMVNNWVLGLLNLGLSYYFILEYGLIGAALGTASSLAVVNLVRLGELKYLEGLWPYDRTYVKPVAAAASMGVVLVGFDIALSGVTLLVVGSVIGTLAYGAVLYLLGIEERDRRVFQTLLGQYRAWLPGSRVA